MRSILFVCLGNICRSPMADAIARHRAGGDRLLDSAGTGAYHVGETADPRTLAVLERNGIPYDGRARAVEASDFERFDLLLAMDRSNLANLQRICPPEHRHKLHLVLEPTTGGEVGDPYYGGPDGFDLCFEQLSDALEHWLEA